MPTSARLSESEQLTSRRPCQLTLRFRPSASIGGSHVPPAARGRRRRFYSRRSDDDGFFDVSLPVTKFHALPDGPPFIECSAKILCENYDTASGRHASRLLKHGMPAMNYSPPPARQCTPLFRFHYLRNGAFLVAIRQNTSFIDAHRLMT